MSLSTWTARNLFAPSFDVLRGTHTMSRLSELEQMQWWPLERIRETQSHHLRRLVAHVYESVPYYRTVMDERGIRPADIVSVEDLRLLPPLKKADIGAHFDDLLARNVPVEQLRSGWSGGTTGERLNYRSTRQERFSYAYARWLLTFEWTGAQLGDAHVSIRQASARPRSNSERLLNSLRLRLQRLKKIDTMRVTEENLAELADTIRRARPRGAPENRSTASSNGRSR